MKFGTSIVIADLASGHSDVEGAVEGLRFPRSRGRPLSTDMVIDVVSDEPADWDRAPHYFSVAQIGVATWRFTGRVVWNRRRADLCGLHRYTITVRPVGAVTRA